MARYPNEENEMAEADTLTQLKTDMKEAMKAKDKDTLSTVRMLISSLQNQAIELKRDLTEDDILDVLSTEAKKRRDAAEQYREGDREELAEKEDTELEVIEKYLPKQLSDTEVAQMIDEVISEVGAETKRDMGKVMGPMMQKVKGRFDGSKVKDMVLEKLP